MKRWKLSELFSQINILMENLPEISYKEEVSYKNVQKKVFEKLDSRETISTEPDKKETTKRIIIGVSLLALLTAGGLGAVSSSRAARTGIQETEPTAPTSSIDSVSISAENIIKGTSETTAPQSNKQFFNPDGTALQTTVSATVTTVKTEQVQTAVAAEAFNEAMGDSNAVYYTEPIVNLHCNKSQDIEYTPPENERYTENIYQYDVIDHMNEVDVKSVGMCTDQNGTWIIVHMTHSFPEGTDFFDMELNPGIIISCYTINPQYGQSNSIGGEKNIQTDGENLYMKFRCPGEIDPMLNEFVINICGIYRNGVEEYSLLDIKNVFGFTGAEIAQRVPFTPEQQAQLDKFYVQINNDNSNPYYLKKSDIMSSGCIQVQVDPSQQKLDPNKNPIPSCYGQLFSSELNADDEAVSVENNFALLYALKPQVKNAGKFTEVLVRFDSPVGYKFNVGDEDFFQNVKAQLYTILPDTGERRQIDCSITNDYLVDQYGSLMIKYDVEADPMDNVFLRLEYENIIDSNLDVIDEGNILIDIPLNAVGGNMDYYYIDSVTTEGAFNIDISYNGSCLSLDWQGTADNTVPVFIEPSGVLEYNPYNLMAPDYVVEDCIISTKYGFDFPVRLQVRVREDYSVTANAYAYYTCYMNNPAEFIYNYSSSDMFYIHDAIDHITINGTTFYIAP